MGRLFKERDVYISVSLTVWIERGDNSMIETERIPSEDFFNMRSFILFPCETPSKL